MFLAIVDSIVLNTTRVIIFIQWIMLRIFNISLSYQETFNRSYVHKKYQQEKCPDTAEEENLESIKKWAIELYESVGKRKNSVDDKVKVIMSLSTLSIPIIISAFSGGKANGFYIGALTLLFITIIFVMIYFSVEFVAFPSLDTKSWQSKSRQFETDLINSYLYCFSRRSENLDFMTDVFRASRRSFLLGFFMLALGFSYSQVNLYNTDDRKYVLTVKGDDLLIKKIEANFVQMFGSLYSKNIEKTFDNYVIKREVLKTNHGL